MTDEVQTDHGSTDVQLVSTVDGDVVLQSFAETVQRNDALSMSLTLTVPAGIVTGLMIGRSRWFREVGELHPEIAGLANQLSEEAGPDPETPEDELLWTYIHLRDARILTGGRWVETSRSMHWRGRISEITGWSFGMFEPQDYVAPGE